VANTNAAIADSGVASDAFNDVATVSAGVSARQYQAKRRREATRNAQEIGEIPPIADPIRRQECLADFELFCKTYGSAAFHKPWAEYHRKSAAKMQAAAEQGGWFAFAEPRGSGKTTRAKWSALWAILKGLCPYVVLIAANETLAKKLLKSIKTELSTNELLLADFPHAILPIRKLEGEARRCQGQKYNGQSTAIEWDSNHIVLPWIVEPDSLSSGAVLESFGLTSAVRGLQHTRQDGTVIRPSLVIIDDPQTRESARSLSQTQARLEILTGDVAYLAGPGEPIALLCPCTVVCEADLADRILDREKHPEWHGERTAFVASFPTNTTLWDAYADLLRASWREDGNGDSATEFYRLNREAMDADAQVAWPECHRPDELSGLQAAMNFKIRDEASFFAEWQNEPLIQQHSVEMLGPDEIARKTTNYGRRVVPPNCSAITAFTDVQKEHLFYCVVAWKPDFTGYVIDYGAWPDQKRNYFTRRDLRHKLSDTYPGDDSGIMFAALTDLRKLLATPYTTADGRELNLSRWCIDGNWQERHQAVKTFAQQSDISSIITLTSGRGVRATEKPFSEAQRAIKWKTFPGWFWTDGPGPAREIVFDTNLWKSRVHNALYLATESVGSIQLFNSKQHQMFCEHLCAEKPIKTEANGRTVHEWRATPGQDNEGLDCIVGCAVGASIAGIARTAETIPRKKTAKRRISYAA
jgi:hypothetical protein